MSVAHLRAKRSVGSGRSPGSTRSEARDLGKIFMKLVKIKENL